jgi:DNA-binding response OmpR family regulator
MAAQRSILVVEDEADLAELIRFNLEREGYEVRVATNGQAGLQEVLRRAPHLVVLDRMLPVMSGDELLTKLRRDAATASVPVIMLTAKAEESDELIGLTLGADDYLAKPCSMKLLAARVAAMFRRHEAASEKDVLTEGPFRLDTTRYEVTVQGRPIPLTATEFKLLRALMTANGRVLNRDQLIDSVMGADVAVTDRTIDVHVAALRRKAGEGAEWIQTIRGVGYAFRPAS